MNNTPAVPPSPALARQFLIVLVVSAILQISIAALPDTSIDVPFYRLWMKKLVNADIAIAYWDQSTIQSAGPDFYYPIDYPPVLPYLLLTLGKVIKWIAPVAFEHNDPLLDFLIKLLSIAANLITASLIFFGLRSSNKPKVALLAAGFYALNPAIIFDVAYWGQTDSITALLILLALVLVVRGNPELAWVCITLGAFTKPLVLPFVPIVLLGTWKFFPARRVLTSTCAAVLTTFLIFLPFLLLGQFSTIVRGMFLQIDAMPYVSVNAHNLWWLAGGGLPWVQANVKVMNLIAYKAIGIILFSVFYGLSLWKFARSQERSSIYVVSAGVAFGFFILSTHMHENHLFHFFPLVSMIFPFDARLKRIALILTITFLANMALHDPYLTTAFREYGVGPRLTLPPQSDVGASIFEYFSNQGNPYLGVQAKGDSSLLWLLATILNSQVNVLIFLYWLYLFYLQKNFDAFSKAAFPWKAAVVFAIVFAGLSGGFVLHRAVTQINTNSER
jgi:Gpi18-like mannosyltransferase